MADSSLPTNLEALVDSWKGQLLSLVKGLAPAHLRDAVFVNSEEADGHYVIRVTVNRNAYPRPNYGSLDARAQEYGSGLRARVAGKNSGQTIPINAKGGYIASNGVAYLVFKNKEGRIIKTKHVDHPGIEAYNGGEGYVAPAIELLRQKGRAELSQAIRSAILTDIRTSFGGRVK